MTRDKDLKRLVRARMQKTGESYTAARSNVIRRTATPPKAAPADVAGMSDDAVRAKTGRTWRGWVRVLDAVDAAVMPHRDIARHLRDQHGLTGWWSQTVTVGYERIKGLRDVGQRRGGTYEANKSKTVAAPVSALYRAFADARRRRRWLPGIEWTVRTRQPDKSIRVTWPDGTRVEFYFIAKGDAKSTVTVQHTKLPDRAAVARARAQWAERLAALSDMLSARQ